MPLKKKSSIPLPPPPPPVVTKATPPHTPVISSPIIASSSKNGVNSSSITSENILQSEPITEPCVTEDTAVDIAADISSTRQSEITINSSEGGQEQIEKPKPPTKSSRLKRALTSGSLTMNRFSKKKDSNKRLSMTIEGDAPSQTTPHIREGGLWQLPGMDLAAARKELTPTPHKKIHKDSESQAKFDEIANKLKKELPILPRESSPPRESSSSIDNGSGLKNRELPPLPALLDTPPSHITHPHTSHISPKQSVALNNFDTYSELQPTEEAATKLSESISSQASEGEPPPLPARVYMLSANDPLRPSEAPPTITEPLDSTLQSALRVHAGCYPLRFRVLQGYCNDTTDVQMSTDDVYDMHTIRETKV